MSQNQLQQNKRQPNQQNRQNQKSERNDSGQFISDSRIAEKSCTAEMLAAAEAFALGKVGAKTAEAASFFGNQAMLNLAEQSSGQRNNVNYTAGVLGGEKDCVFAEDSPENNVNVEAAFGAESVPAFSTEAPSADIQQIGTLASEYLM